MGGIDLTSSNVKYWFGPKFVQIKCPLPVCKKIGADREAPIFQNSQMSKIIEPESICAGSGGQNHATKTVTLTRRKLTKNDITKKPSPGYFRIWCRFLRTRVNFYRIWGSCFWSVHFERKNQWFLSLPKFGPKLLLSK